MGYKILILAFIVSCSGCDCDSICQSNREASAFLSNYKESTEVAEYLVTYSGEAPGSEKRNVFIRWGLKNKAKFIAIVNDPKITDDVVGLLIYSISDIGYSNEYCELLSGPIEGVNIKKLKAGILGCQNTSL